MALIWEKQLCGNRYEVRAAGSTTRLYTNGVFHSEFNPNRGLAGSLWDLLVLPAFFSPTPIRRILVLGVGGGAVIQKLRRFVPSEAIVGVDRDPVHLHIARRFFGLRGKGIRLHRAEARRWLEGYRGEPFDLVIEDLLTDQEGRPVRAIEADASWFEALLRHMTPRGILVVNFESARTLRRSAYFRNPAIARKFACAFRLTTLQNHNVVAAFLRKTSEVRAWRQNLAAKAPSQAVNIRPRPL